MIREKFKNQATPKGARSLAKSIVQFLREREFDENLLYDVDLALTEACSNIVLHSYSNQSAGEIEIALKFEPGNFLELEIMDWGKPFKGPKDNNLKISPDTETGRGIYLISQLMDSFSYSHRQNKNILYLEKKLRGAYENT